MTATTSSTSETDTMKNEFTPFSGGVKDLVDSGLPIIDLNGVHGETRSIAVEKIRRASESWGFFQLMNHGIPQRVLDEMIQGVRRFHEQSSEEKMKLISEDQTSNEITYICGLDSKPALWKDSLMYNFAEDQLDSQALPSVCREIVVEYLGGIVKLKDLLCELLSEGLDLCSDHLKNTGCLNGGAWVGHYYPPCPDPDTTLGVGKHTDDSCCTILLQDQLGGLQVLNQNKWKDATPVRGALLVNIGDFLQVMSNDRFKSVFHRVIPKPVGPRISVPVFFYSNYKDYSANVIGPIDELLSEDDPPIYKKFTLAQYFEFMFAFEHTDGTQVVSQHFKL